MKVDRSFLAPAGMVILPLYPCDKCRAMIDLTDDGNCFACGNKNPIGLQLRFTVHDKKISAEFIPGKEHQGYSNTVHGGIIATLLDESMVKLAAAMAMPAVTVRMEIRFKKSLRIGEKINIEARLLRTTRKLIDAYAEVLTEGRIVVAYARGRLVKV